MFEFFPRHCLDAAAFLEGMAMSSLNLSSQLVPMPTSSAERAERLSEISALPVAGLTLLAFALFPTRFGKSFTAGVAAGIAVTIGYYSQNPEQSYLSSPSSRP